LAAGAEAAAGAAGGGVSFAATGFGTGGGVVTLGTVTWTAAVPARTGEPLIASPRIAPESASLASALAVESVVMRRSFLCCL
jgi:hypothetical protein